MTYWQALDSGRILLMAATAMLVIAAFAGFAAPHPHPSLRVAVGGFIVRSASAARI